MDCHGYPGPGDAEHRILSNPMAEYIHGQDEHVHVMFDKFKKKHGKKYPNYSEEMKRKQLFRDNIRSVAIFVGVNKTGIYCRKKMYFMLTRMHSVEGLPST